MPTVEQAVEDEDTGIVAAAPAQPEPEPARVQIAGLADDVTAVVTEVNQPVEVAANLAQGRPAPKVMEDDTARIEIKDGSITITSKDPPQPQAALVGMSDKMSDRLKAELAAGAARVAAAAEAERNRPRRPESDKIKREQGGSVPVLRPSSFREYANLRGHNVSKDA